MWGTTWQDSNRKTENSVYGKLIQLGKNSIITPNSLTKIANNREYWTVMITNICRKHRIVPEECIHTMKLVRTELQQKF